MSRLESLLVRNRAFAETGAHENLGPRPKLGLFVVTCFDSRVEPAHLLGTELGDLIVVRNEGGRVTDEVIDKVVFLLTLQETLLDDAAPNFEIAIIHHTNCMTSFLTHSHVRKNYAARTGKDETGLADLAVVDPEVTVAHDVALLRAHASIPPSVTISGHVYDVHTGLITTVVVAERTDGNSGGSCAIPGATG